MRFKKSSCLHHTKVRGEAASLSRRSSEGTMQVKQPCIGRGCRLGLQQLEEGWLSGQGLMEAGDLKLEPALISLPKILMLQKWDKIWMGAPFFTNGLLNILNPLLRPAAQGGKKSQYNGSPTMCLLAQELGWRWTAGLNVAFTAADTTLILQSVD